MSEKDFLSQFSGKNTVPESFREEERKPVYKQKKPVNKVLIIVLCVLLLAVGMGVYFIFFAPKIEMPNFEGKTKNDVAAWVKQQDIETSGIVFEEDYYFDYDEGVIISQSIESGKKVKENVKINFVASLGADPDELIKTPDLMNMTKSEIQEWIDKNKLTKTKVTTAYSDEVEEGNVISFAYSGCEEDTFTRSSTLKISVSKGEAPAGSIAVKDFVKGTYDAAETWANTNKVKVSKTEQYSDTVTAGLVISQSIESGKTMKEGETLNLVVSLGKAVKVIDLSGYLQEDATNWCSENGLVAKTKIRYTSSDNDCGNVVEQSVIAGKTVAAGETIELTISKGKLRASSFKGTTKDELRTWIKEANTYGAGLTLGSATYQISDDVAVGDIIGISFSDDYVNYVVSKGKNIFIPSDFDFTINSTTETEIRTKLDALKVTYVVDYKTGTVVENKVNKVMEIYYVDGNVTVKDADIKGKYVTQDITIHVVICDEAYSGT